MSTADLLEEALGSIGLPVKYFQYDGTEETYIVYNEEVEQPTNFGDNLPLNEIVWWQVHIFAPKKSEFRGKKNKVKEALLRAGFLVTDTVTRFEKETGTIHVIVSCHKEEREE